MFLSRFVASSLSVVAIVALAPASFAQSVFVVDASGGPGSNFTTIGAAVTAASDGDFVLVRAGFYPEIVTLDGIGLVIQAAAGASVGVRAIEVENLGSAQFVAVRGLARYNPGHISLRSNQGSVWIEDSAHPIAGFDAAYLEAVDCASVVVRNSTFMATTSSVPAYSTVYIQDSNVALEECQVDGLDQSSCNTGGPYPAYLGIGVFGSSRVALYAGSVSGGDGCLPTMSSPGGPGGPALWASGPCVVEIVGTTLVGGTNGSGGPPVPAIQTFSGATVIQRPGRAHLLATPSPVTSGARTPVALTGDPGDLVFALIANTPGPFMTAGNWFGPLVVSMQSPRMFLGIVPGSGSFSINVTAPTLLAGDLVESFYLQPVFLGGGEIALGTPTQVHVLDPSL